jgi:hypothetical protein
MVCAMEICKVEWWILGKWYIYQEIFGQERIFNFQYAVRFWKEIATSLFVCIYREVMEATSIL